MPANTDNIIPVVFAQGDTVVADSRDVAAFFEKEHFHVLRDIDQLLEKQQHPDLDEAISIPKGWFVEHITPRPADNPGRPFRHFDMTRDGFTLLAVGFKGAKALAFKLRYIQAFNAMEESLTAASENVLNAHPGDIRMCLDMVREARHAFGRAAARRMWNSLPLPKVEDERGPARENDGSGLECVNHLLGSSMRGRRGECRAVKDWARDVAEGRDVEYASSVLLSHGLAVRGAPRSRNRSMDYPGGLFLWVAHHHSALAHLFEGTRWKRRAWAFSLSGIHGAMSRVSFWCSGQCKAVLVPLEMCGLGEG